jgi:hypothetical protein
MVGPTALWLLGRYEGSYYRTYSCRIASALVAIYDTSCCFMLITSYPFMRTHVHDGFQGDTRGLGFPAMCMEPRADVRLRLWYR